MKNKQSKTAKDIEKLIGEEEYYEKLKQALIASVGDENEKFEEVKE